jgi:Zn-dependent peptidase ImmA (M78 family)
MQCENDLKVEYLEDSKIEKITSKILQEASSQGIYEDRASPVELMGEKFFNLQYVYVDLEKDFGLGTLGSLDFSSNTIFLNERHFGNENCNIGLLNFTIAHEIGHFILHKEIYDKSAEKIALLHKKQVKNYEKTLKRIEFQANLFSANLLMPKDLFTQEWKKLKGMNYWEKRKMTCDFFEVSKKALEVRLQYLNLN